MHIIHQATIKNTNGIIDIDIYIVSDKIRHYVYHLASEYAARLFHSYYKKGKGLHGHALKVLNRFKIVDENA